MEIYRASWELGPPPVQWNLVRSVADTVRGVHVHIHHADYWTLAHGRATVGFRDLRLASRTRGVSGELHLSSNDPRLLFIPPGVAHGFQFHEESVHVYAVTHYWDLRDELGCRWDDPALSISWPSKKALLSARDRDACSLEDLVREFETRQAEYP